MIISYFMVNTIMVKLVSIKSITRNGEAYKALIYIPNPI